MRDYSELHDAEINMLVCKQLGLGLSSYCRILSVGDYSILLDDNKTLVDYCNNPADAWPIIVKNKLHLTTEEDGIWSSRGYSDKHVPIDVDHANPLRAAMIVYLQMMEKKS